VLNNAVGVFEAEVDDLYLDMNRRGLNKELEVQEENASEQVIAKSRRLREMIHEQGQICFHLRIQKRCNRSRPNLATYFIESGLSEVLLSSSDGSLSTKPFHDSISLVRTSSVGKRLISICFCTQVLLKALISDIWAMLFGEPWVL
jgi:hypothetical protein